MPNTIPDQDEPERGRPTEPDLPARETLPDLDETNLEGQDAGPDAPSEAEPQAEAEPTAPPKPPKSWVYFLVGGLLFASVAGPLAFYFLVWRYRPTAPQHIPQGSTVAVRLDGRELYLNEPFRKHVLGALEDQPGLESHVERIKSRTGIDLRSDVREIVLATTTGQSFVVILGGRLGRTRIEQQPFPEGVYTVLTEKQIPGFTMEGAVMVGPGFRVAQAEDDTVIIGTDEEIVRAALEPSEAWKTLGLSSSGAMSFVIDSPALTAAARTSPAALADALGKSDKVTGFLRLDKAKLYVDVVPSSGVRSEELGPEIDEALTEARTLSLLLPDAYGAKGALASARVKPRPETVMIEADWPREGFDQAFERMGSVLRTVLAGTKP